MAKTVDILITGGTIVTLDERDSMHTPGALAIDGDTIVALGGKEEILSDPTRDGIQSTFRSSIIMPGLVNAHTHAAMTCFRGIADDMELMDWLNNYIFPAEARNVNPELAYWGSLLACAEMIKSGTTTFSDMYIFEEETAQAAKQAGMRCLLGEVLFDFPSPNFKTPAEGLAYTEKLIRTVGRRSSRQHHGGTPFSLHLLSGSPESRQELWPTVIRFLCPRIFWKTRRKRSS